MIFRCWIMLRWLWSVGISLRCQLSTVAAGWQIIPLPLISVRSSKVEKLMLWIEGFWLKWLRYLIRMSLGFLGMSKLICWSICSTLANHVLYFKSSLCKFSSTSLFVRQWYCDKTQPLISEMIMCNIMELDSDLFVTTDMFVWGELGHLGSVV